MLIKIQDLPPIVQTTVIELTDFIRSEGRKLPYDELLLKFTEGSGITDQTTTYQVTNEEDDLFDFDFGCLWGTFARDEETGEAILDILQWYPDVDDEEPEVINLDISNI